MASTLAIVPTPWENRNLSDRSVTVREDEGSLVSPRGWNHVQSGNPASRFCLLFGIASAEPASPSADRGEPATTPTLAAPVVPASGGAGIRRWGVLLVVAVAQRGVHRQRLRGRQHHADRFLCQRPSGRPVRR